MSVLKISIHAHGFTTLTYTPIECSNIDFLGPFPDKGYILVIVCTFTQPDLNLHSGSPKGSCVVLRLPQLPELSELLELLQRELYDILQIFYRSIAIAIVWCALVKAREKLSVLY